MSYIEVIKNALVFFPVIAFLLTIPFILIEYHRYGSVNKLRTLIVYSFVLYLLIIYFLVILPLPDIEEVSHMTGPIMNLIPFSFITDIIKETSFNISAPSTYLRALTESCVYVVFFNILMTIPFGMYLRYYYKCDLRHTIIFTFLLSLFFEITQLTGLYFIYPRPYRLFDIDDLILNTAGGILGFYIMGIFKKALPTRDTIDKNSIKAGTKVSGLRRITLYTLDTFIYISIIIVLEIIIKTKISSILIISTSTIYFVLIPYIFNGYTCAGKFLNIKLRFPNHTFIRLIIKTVLTYLNYFGVVYLIVMFMIKIYPNFNINTYISIFIFVEIALTLLIFYLINTIHILRTSKAYYDKYSKVEYVSTIKELSS